MKRVLLSLLLISSSSMAAECTGNWHGMFWTDLQRPKGMSGDTAAVYANFSWKADPNLKLVIRGEYPRARFMSFQTYRTRLTLKNDAVFDHQIEPNSDSGNPFRPGAMMDHAGEQYEIEVLPEGTYSNHRNQLSVKRRFGVQTIMYRVYVPEDPQQIEFNMPRIYAYDVRTGRERSCPKDIQLPFYLNLPQLMINWVPEKDEIEFTRSGVSFGPNFAVPYYVHGMSKLKRGDVAMMRFRAPTYLGEKGEKYFTTEPDVRYWSLCAHNMPKNTTLGCVADFLHDRDKLGDEVVVVFGGGAQAKAHSEAMGYHWLPDNRPADQKVILFNYRNLLPNPEFQENHLYQGEYRPQAWTCTVGELVAGSCGS